MESKSFLTAFLRSFPLGWALAGLVYATVLVMVALAFHHGDFFYFVNLSPYFITGDPNAPQGYDGQFSYFIATDPINGIPVPEERAFRTQRILYPLFAYLLSFGQAKWAPITLVVVNILALAIGTCVFAMLLNQEGAPRWTPLVFFLWVGIAQALLYDLNEIVAITFSLGAILFLLRERIVWSGALFGLAALGKELGFLFAVPAVGYLLLQRRWRAAVELGVLTVLPYVIWMVIIRLLYGSWSFQTRATQFELIPFGGLYNADSALPFVVLFLIIPAVLALILAYRNWNGLYTLILLAGFLFLVFLPYHSYQTAAVFRVNSTIVVAGSLLLAKLRRRGALLLMTALWSVTAVMIWLLVVYPT